MSEVPYEVETSDDAIVSVRAIVARLNNVLILPTYTVAGSTHDEKNPANIANALAIVASKDNSDEDYDDEDRIEARQYRLYFSSPANVNSRPFLVVQHQMMKIPQDEVLKGFTGFPRTYAGLERALDIYKGRWEGIARRTAETSYLKTASQEYLGTVTTNIAARYPPLPNHTLNPANGGLKISASRPNAVIVSITLNQIKEAEVMYLMEALEPFLSLPTTYEGKD